MFICAISGRSGAVCRLTNYAQRSGPLSSVSGQPLRGFFTFEQGQQRVVPILGARWFALALCKQPLKMPDVCVVNEKLNEPSERDWSKDHGSGATFLYELYCSQTPAYLARTIHPGPRALRIRLKSVHEVRRSRRRGLRSGLRQFPIWVSAEVVFPRHARFPPVSDRTADIAAGPVRAKSGSKRGERCGVGERSLAVRPLAFRRCVRAPD